MSEDSVTANGIAYWSLVPDTRTMESRFAAGKVLAGGSGAGSKWHW